MQHESLGGAGLPSLLGRIRRRLKRLDEGAERRVGVLSARSGAASRAEISEFDFLHYAPLARRNRENRLVRKSL